MDPARLLEVIPFIIEKNLNIRSLLVVRNGYLVWENYYAQGMPDRAATIHSVTKSVTSAVVGLARGQGYLPDLDTPLPDLLPGYFDAQTEPGKRKITFRNLLTMTAGLQPVRVRDRSLLLRWYFAPDPARFTLDLPLEHPPGEVFAYSNPLSHLLSVILTEQTGRPLLDLAQERLFGPLGFKPSIWPKDAKGYYGGHGGLHLTSRQMARFGFLYLNQGRWEEKQVIPAQWVRVSTQAQVKAGPDYDYGFQWWVRPVNGCPSYRAWGHGGQFIVVVPDLDLVVVVTSATELTGRSSGHYSPLFDIIARAVVDRGCGQEGKNVPGFRVVSLPPDLKDFLDQYTRAVVQDRPEAILDLFSDSFLDSGRTKSSLIAYYELVRQAVTSFRIRVDQCRLKGDKAWLLGQAETNLGLHPLLTNALIKENGRWKWLGNQKEN
jgi:CubicO group peptidase (beta-lactamase class C family)